jgi:hypothetical protein
MAIFPTRLRSSAASWASDELLIRVASIASSAESIRLMKKLATLATLLRSPPVLASFSRPQK